MTSTEQIQPTGSILDTFDTTRKFYIFLHFVVVTLCTSKTVQLLDGRNSTKPFCFYFSVLHRTVRRSVFASRCVHVVAQQTVEDSRSILYSTSRFSNH